MERRRDIPPATQPIDELCYDANGVDVSLVEYFVSLTPAQRLDHVEQFANAVLTARKSLGVAWSDSGKY